MAKAGKQDHGHSVLWAAFEARERGDVVEARRLAKAVLAGSVGPNDERVAKELAETLTSDTVTVPATVEGVARELLGRTVVPPKPYLMLAAVAAAYVLLVIIAVVRY